MSIEKSSKVLHTHPLHKGDVVRRFFLTEKPRIGKFPLEFKFSFRRNEWYLFPQGWSHLHIAKDDVCRFEYHYKYNFSWLFIDLEWTQRLRKVGI
jgi:hypothetical protein